MVENIKSKYIVKIIFTYVNERQKLKIIKHNKNIQKNIDININNYKHFTGKYLIYESSGIGKEYDGYYDKLIFEGEYLNGERNGKGKEYDFKGRIIFEGEYLNGKRNGKGKEYFIDDIIIFDGEYLDGERNGKGKEYYYDGIINFEGKYLNGKEWMGIKYHEDGKIKYILDNNINGKRKEYDGGLLSFKGEYLNGKRNGKGKEYWGSVLIFEGEYLNGYKNGKGKKYYENSVLEFEGEYKNDKKWSGKGYDPMNNIIYEVRNGKGLIKEYYYYMPKDAKLQFEGEYLYGEKNGKGNEYYKGALIFKGEYLNDKRWNGKGIQIGCPYIIPYN